MVVGVGDVEALRLPVDADSARPAEPGRDPVGVHVRGGVVTGKGGHDPRRADPADPVPVCNEEARLRLPKARALHFSIASEDGGRATWPTAMPHRSWKPAAAPAASLLAGPPPASSSACPPAGGMRNTRLLLTAYSSPSGPKSKARIGESIPTRAAAGHEKAEAGGSAMRKRWRQVESGT